MAMQPEGSDERLSRIDTLWTLVQRAHAGEALVAGGAQEQLLMRYGRAIRRYLTAAVRDAEAADEIFQDFALRFVKGDLRGVVHQPCRFRDYLKGVLYHLIADHYRRRRVQTLPLYQAAEPVDRTSPEQDMDRAFVESWRNELIDRAWEALAREQAQSGPPFFSVLRFRVNHPEMRSADVAAQLSGELGKPLRAEWVRQTLHRARERFAQLLINELEQTLDSPTRDQVEAELLDLGLFHYCQMVFDQRSNS
jgi:RNA polymerase sigma-70 factor (ECF subfamily)